MSLRGLRVVRITVSVPSVVEEPRAAEKCELVELRKPDRVADDVRGLISLAA
jgi:hypothetical protein